MNKNYFIVLPMFLLLLTACGPRYESYKYVDTTNLVQLEQIRVESRSASSCYRPGSTTSAFSGLRLRALSDSAMSIGAQGGLAWASGNMNKSMNQDRKYLDSIFNFNAMMLTHGVLPPVLVEGDYSLNLADPNTIRVADRTYKIVHQARFATTPPNWREYLLLPYAKPTLPHVTLLPRTDAESRVWCAAIRLGWAKGVEQAYTIFQQNLARLKRDYRGMILYRKLLQQRMISQPFVARTELGVTGDGNDMRINDQVLRIVELPQLQTNTKCWKPVIVRR